MTTAEPERWWISDGHVDLGGPKILGPFESRDLALDVRRLYEDHPDARGLTYWVSKEGEFDKSERVVRRRARTRDTAPGGPTNV